MAESNFILADEIAELTYNFKPYVSAEGVIPEPSDVKIKEFQKALRKTFGPVLETIAENDGKAQKEVLLSAIQKMKESEDNDDLQAQADEQIEYLLRACAKVCSNKPTYAQMNALPYRAKRVFIGWLVGTFLSPEAKALATN